MGIEIRKAIKVLKIIRGSFRNDCVEWIPHTTLDKTDSIDMAIESLERELFAPSKAEKPEIIHDCHKTRSVKKARKIESQE